MAIGGGASKGASSGSKATSTSVGKGAASAAKSGTTASGSTSIGRSAGYVAPVAGQSAASIASRNAIAAANNAAVAGGTSAGRSSGGTVGTTAGAGNVSGTQSYQAPASIGATAGTQPVMGGSAGVTPTVDKIRAGWDKLGTVGQQNFLKSNPTFDPNKYGLTVTEGEPAKTEQEAVQENAKVAIPEGVTVDTVGEGAATAAAPVGNVAEAAVKAGKASRDVVGSEYWDNSPERMAQIGANLQNAYATNPAVFGNRNDFNKAFNYGVRSPRQKQELDKFFNRIQKITAMSTVPTNVLVDKITYGRTSIDSTSPLKDSDPTKYQSVVDGVNEGYMNIQNESNMTATDALNNGTTPALPDWMTSNSDAIDKAIEEYKDAKNDPDLLAKKDKINELTAQVNQLDEDMLFVKDDIIKRYPGITGAQLNALVADATEDYQETRGIAMINISMLQGQVNDRLDQAKEDFELEQKRIEAEQLDFTNKMDVYKTAWSQNYQMQQLELQKAASEQGKYTTVADPLGRGYIVTNTKTGESTLKTFDELGGGASSIGFGTGDYRTDRMNNPTAFTTDVAKQAGLVEGVDYIRGDAFPNNPNMFTAKLLGDPIETTKRVIDAIGFTTKAGKPRWAYTDKLGLDNQTWSQMSDAEKTEAIKTMYKMEGGNGSLFGETVQKGYTDNQLSALKSAAAAKDAKTQNQWLANAGLDQSDLESYRQGAGTAEEYKPYLNALKNVPLQSKLKEEYITTLNEYLADGDTENAKTLIVNALEKAAGVDAAKPYTLATQTLSVLNSLESDVKKFEQLGGNTNIFKGTIEGLFKRAGAVSNPTLRSLATRIAANMQQYRLKITGAAFSPEESAEYEALFPSIGNVPALNSSIIKGTKSAMKDNIKGFLQAGLKNNYDAIFGTEYDSSVMGNNNTSYFNTYDAVNSSNAGSTPNNILNQIGVSFGISF